MNMGKCTHARLSCLTNVKKGTHKCWKRSVDCTYLTGSDWSIIVCEHICCSYWVACLFEVLYRKKVEVLSFSPLPQTHAERMWMLQAICSYWITWDWCFVQNCRLFDENGIDFPKLKAQKEKKGVQKVPVGAALKFCCKGGCPHPTTDFNSALPLLNNSSDSFTDDFGDNSPDKTIDASQQGPAFSLSQNSADNEILSVKSVNYSAGFVTDDSTANSIDEPALSTPDDLAVKPNQLRLESVFTRTVQTSSISSPTIAVSLFPIFIVVLWWVWKKEGENHRAHRGSLSFQGVKGTQWELSYIEDWFWGLFSPY